MALRPIVRALVVPVLGLSLSGIAAHPALAEGDGAAPAPHKVVNINQASSARSSRACRASARSWPTASSSTAAQHGAFKRPEDLMQVKGVGEKFFATLKPYLAVSGPTTLAEKVSSKGSRGGHEVLEVRLLRDEGRQVRQDEGLSPAFPKGRRGARRHTNGAAPSPFLRAPKGGPMRASGRSSERGFSLLELLAVLAVLGVLFLLSIPALSEILAEESLGTAAREVAAILHAARARAVFQGADVGVKWVANAGDLVLTVYQDGNGNGVAGGRHPEAASTGSSRARTGSEAGTRA